MRVVMIVMIVLILGALFIANKEQTDFKNINSTIVFAKIYSKWVWQVGKNVKDLAVIAYHMKWLPQLGDVSFVMPGITTLNVTI
jgi:hypothetical protein